MLRPRGRNGDAEFGGDTPCRGFPLRRQGLHGLPRLFEYRGWCRFGRAAVEGRLRRIDHIKLDGLCGRVAAQLSRQAQGAVDSGRDASRKDPGAVYDHAFVDGDRTKERQQVKRDAVTRIVGFFVSAMGVALIFDGVIEALETHGITPLH